MNPMIATYATLGVAIVLEVIGTTCLQRSEQFTKLTPTVIMGVCYLGAFYFLSLTLRTMPVGLAYALWSGIGFIIAGVMIVNLFSKSLSQ